MIQKIFKSIMIIIMLACGVAAISNLTTKSTNAADGVITKEEQVHDEGTPFTPGYRVWCQNPGQGCYTVVPVK